jgi:SAM-dependent methyltransferase
MTRATKRLENDRRRRARPAPIRARVGTVDGVSVYRPRAIGGRKTGRGSPEARTDDSAADKQLTKLLFAFQKVGKPIDVSFREMLRAPLATERATHSLHSYPARLLLNIPSFFLGTSLSKPGQVVLDPFCGSGTVLLEAIRAGRHAIGADSNPLARLITRAKLKPISGLELKRHRASFPKKIPDAPSLAPPSIVNRDYWFYPHVQRDLLRILEPIRRIRNIHVRELFLVAFSDILRDVSLADPRLSVPVRLKKDQYPKKHWLRDRTNRRLAALKHVDVIRTFFDRLDSTIACVEALTTEEHLGQLRALCHDARKLEGIATNSVDFAITSPPYLGAQKYIRASSLSLNWLNLCAAGDLRRLEDQNIGREHFRKSDYEDLACTGLACADRLLTRIRESDPLRAHIAAQYFIEMRGALEELSRVLKPGAHAVLVAGEGHVKGIRFPTPTLLIELASSFGLELKLHLIDTIRSRALMTKRNKTAGTIDTESILLLKKRNSADGRSTSEKGASAKRANVGRASHMA